MNLIWENDGQVLEALENIFHVEVVERDIHHIRCKVPMRKKTTKQ